MTAATAGFSRRPSRSAISTERSIKLVGRDDFVDVADLGGRLRREAASVEHAHEPAVGADEPDEALGAAAARRKSEKDLRLADHEVAGRHHAHVAGEREFRADSHRGAVERRYVDGSRAVHPQEGLVQIEQLHRSAERGRSASFRTPPTTRVPRAVFTTAAAPRGPDAGAGGAAFLQPAKVGVRDESLRVRAGDHDRADAVVGFGSGDQGLEVGCDLAAELSARAALHSGDQNSAALLDVYAELLVGVGGHGGLSLRLG